MTVIDSITDVEKYAEGLDAIVFDLDDTLYGEKEYVRSGYVCVGEAFSDVRDMANRLWVCFEQGKKAFDCVLEEEGLLTPENLARAVEVYRNHLPNVHLYAGVRDMLSRLKAQGKKLGLITDGRVEGQRAKIESLGLRELFDEIVITDELGGIEYRKPNAIAFECMQKSLDVPYGRMAYVGDNMNKDFVAPEKLGMICIHFRNTDGLYYKKP